MTPPPGAPPPDAVALRRVPPPGSPGHRWAQVCAADAGAVHQSVVAPGAVAWQGSPWGPDEWSLAGEADGVATLLRLLRREPGVDHVVVAAEHVGLLAWPTAAEFAIRTTAAVPPAPASPAPGAPVALADGDPRVAALLAAHFPDAEAGPDDPRADGWTGWEVDGRLVAACCRLRTDPDLALLSSLALDAAWRGRGVATALTRAFVADALAGPARRVALGHYTSNAAASRLYDRAGMDREDLVLLRRAG